MTSPARLSALFSLAASIGCGAPPVVPVPATCGGALAPDAVTLVAGGRARIPLGAVLADEVRSITTTGGVTAIRSEGEVIVRADYETATATLTLACDEGALEVPLTIEAVRFEPLLAWDGADASSPAAREYFAWWINPADDDAVYLYGGFVYEPVQFTPSSELWRLDLTSLAWSTVAQNGTAPAPGGRVAASSTSGTTYYFGGGLPAADGALDTPPSLVELASGDPATWTAAPDGDTGPGSYTGAFVHDAARDRWLSICGADSRVLGLNCEVHAYTPETGFVRLAIEGDAPSGRYGFLYAYDAETSRVIVFGGQVGPANEDIVGDTWALELAPDGDAEHPRWTRLFESTEGVMPRRNGAFALDPEGHRFFMWGGTSDGRTGVAGLEVLSLTPGAEAWTHLALGDEAPPRASGGGVYDGARHRILWGFGNSSAALFTDLYALALAPSEAP
jgi:hypothetical protein